MSRRWLFKKAMDATDELIHSLEPERAFPLDEEAQREKEEVEELDRRREAELLAEAARISRHNRGEP